ncbi:MAG: decaprenyl-phosphate phosphoribosyltransferase [Acidimicrobiales bacterium]
MTSTSPVSGDSVRRARPEPGGRRGGPAALAGGLLRAARPKQWTKNVLVFAAPGAAGVLTHAGPLGRSVAAFAIFCAVSSGTYLLNDSVDVAADRVHPTKRSRPLAAGVVPVPLALVAAGTLLAAGVGASGLLGWRMTVTVASYVAVQLAYSLWLKHEPVFDLACVATGFVLRAIAGGVAVPVPISEWFLIVAMFGSLMMVTGKRFAEHQSLGAGRGSHRSTLAAYSEAFLRGLLLASVAVAVTAYCLWAFEKERAAGHGDAIWYQLSIVPFVLGILRYAYLVDAGHGGAPEDVVLSDRALQLVGLAWVVVFALGVYAAG